MHSADSITAGQRSRCAVALVAIALGLAVTACQDEDTTARVCTWSTEAPASHSGDTDEAHVCLDYDDPETWKLEAHHLEPGSTLAGNVRDHDVRVDIDRDGEGEAEIPGRADGEHWPLRLEGTTADGELFRAIIDEEGDEG